ncbi:hemolysin family protein [Granulicoccus sp. GXG6511]|uniref:hemolysin family protein n=1 Tax=Granulicoccus sp. GXG6511 TaxID=3381351 RepID=UPI003D7D3061
MERIDWIALGVALLLTVLAGLMAAAEAALYSFSKARAEVLVDEGRPGAKRLALITADPPPYLNTTLFVRTLFEIGAITLVAMVVITNLTENWQRLLTIIGSMVLVSYVLWGVAPRTLGRQHADRIALAASGPLSMLTTILGPLPQLLILLGNALTPGRGFADGPFSTEAELREMVDKAVASELIEAREHRMIRSVFDLGDSIVKEVMVPRTNVVFIEHNKTLRQAMSLALRSGFSRIPVIGEGGLDDVIGVLYLKDVMKRVYDNANSQTSEKVSSMMREPVWCPDSKPVDELLRDMQASRSHLVLVVDEFGGTAGLATIEDILEEIVGEIVDEFDESEQPPFVQLGPDRYRVSSRLPIDELGELFGLDLDDEDVDSAGGLLAKELNKVPIPGSAARVHGLELVAERGQGRRNQISTLLVTRVAGDDTDDVGVDAAAAFARESADRAT